MPDAECEDGLRPPSACEAQPAGRAGAARLGNPAHHAGASTPEEAPPQDPPEARAKSETRETTPDTPQRAAGRETSPSEHNRDDDSFDAFIESCMGDPHTVPTPAARASAWSNDATVRRTHPSRYHARHTASPITPPWGTPGMPPLLVTGTGPGAEQRTRAQTSAAPQEVGRP